MIIRPLNWKNDLKNELDKFEKFLVEDGCNNIEFDYYLERFFFISAFIIRKLSESKKLSNELIRKKYKIAKFAKKNNSESIDDTNYIFHESLYNTGSIIDMLSMHDNLSINDYDELSLVEASNIIIHSYTMNVFSSANELFGVYITTRERKKNLYFLKFETFKLIIEDCIKDNY